MLCAAAPLTKDQEEALQQKLKNGVMHQGYGALARRHVRLRCHPLKQRGAVRSCW